MLATKVQQYFISIRIPKQAVKKISFFQLGKKDIIKGKKLDGQRDLSKNVDKIVYGV